MIKLHILENTGSDYYDIDDMIKLIKKHPTCKKNLYPYTWVSGSSTKVYPVQFYKERKEIVLQWNSDRECNSFLRWIENTFDNVKKATFNKSDGSCPSYISIYLVWYFYYRKDVFYDKRRVKRWTD